MLDWCTHKSVERVAVWIDAHLLGSFVKGVMRVVSYIDVVREVLLGLGEYEVHARLDHHMDLLLGGLVTNESLCTRAGARNGPRAPARPPARGRPRFCVWVWAGAARGQGCARPCSRATTCAATLSPRPSDSDSVICHCDSRLLTLSPAQLLALLLRRPADGRLLTPAIEGAAGCCWLRPLPLASTPHADGVPTT